LKSTEKPLLSVVIGSINGTFYLESCLESLTKQEGIIPSEIIVVDCVGPEVTKLVNHKFPEIQIIPFESPKSLPDLRLAGIRAASGDIIAITEDHCIVPKDWFSSILQSHKRHEEAAAIGGSVDNAATNRLIDQAVFFCEYASFLSPLSEGITHDLPGPNVSYKREAIQQALEGEYIEVFFHQELEVMGYRFWLDPSITFPTPLIPKPKIAISMLPCQSFFQILVLKSAIFNIRVNIPENPRQTIVVK